MMIKVNNLLEFLCSNQKQKTADHDFKMMNNHLVLVKVPKQ